MALTECNYITDVRNDSFKGMIVEEKLVIKIVFVELNEYWSM